MSETIDDLKRDVRKDPAELEREADMARDAVEDTLFELEQRFSPSELFDRFTDVVKHNGGDFGANLLTQVRNNPVPTIMAGVGLAWLMASSKQPPAARQQHDAHGLADRFSAAMGSGRGAAESARDKAHSAAESARNTASAAADVAKNAAEAATNAASRAAATARRTSDSLRRASVTGAQSVAECYSYLSREQPLVLGAIAIAAGAAIGAFLPSTRTEDEWIGETSDAAKSQLKAKAKEQLDDLQEAGGEAAEAARETLAGENGADAAEAPRETRGANGAGASATDEAEMHPSSR
jgi:hypothetical protein